MAHLHVNQHAVTVAARRYDHSYPSIGSGVHLTFTEREYEVAYVGLTADDAARLGRELLDLAEHLTAVPWEQTAAGRAWAEKQGEGAGNG